MKLANYVLIVLLVVGCKNKELEPQAEVIFKNPSVVPENIQFESRTLETVLNPALFNAARLGKNEVAVSKDFIDPANFPYQGNLVSYLKKTTSNPPEIFGARELLHVKLSFECDDCMKAYFIRSSGNNKQITSEVIRALNKLDANAHEIPKKNDRYEYSSRGTQLELDGLVGFYLVLKDINNELFIYELAGVHSDATSPAFETSETCDNTTVGKPYEGLVCLTAMSFQGDDVSGYNVPFKGQVYGDVAEIVINKKNFEVSPGAFFERMKMQLFIGYNQVPIAITDRLGNITHSFIEIDLEEIKPEGAE